MRACTLRAAVGAVGHVGHVADMHERHVALLDIDIDPQLGFRRRWSAPAGCWSCWSSSSAPARRDRRTARSPRRRTARGSARRISSSRVCATLATAMVKSVSAWSAACCDVQPCATRSLRPLPVALLVLQVAHCGFVLLVGLDRGDGRQQIAGLHPIAAIDRDRRDIAADLAVERRRLIRPRVAEQLDQPLLRALRHCRDLHHRPARDALGQRLARCRAARRPCRATCAAPPSAAPPTTTMPARYNRTEPKRLRLAMRGCLRYAGARPLRRRSAHRACAGSAACAAAACRRSAR